MNQNKEDLKQIRAMMERSTKFLSLSGYSGIVAGAIALAGAAVAYRVIFRQGDVRYDASFRWPDSATMFGIRLQMLLLALSVLVCAISAAWYFSSRKAKKAGHKLWSSTAKRTLFHFLIPLVSGGIFCIALVIGNNIHLIASATLVFYGLALVNAGKFTVGEVHYLGISEIALGLAAVFFPNYGFIFWILGFGIMHIVYGIRICYKYDRQ
jgi:hypothetical protein